MEKRSLLEKIKPFPAKVTYRPLRHEVEEILNINIGPLLTAERAPWSLIETDIRERSRHENEAVANIKFGKLLYDFASTANAVGRRLPLSSLYVGASHEANYWPSGTVTLFGKETLPYIDPRKVKGISCNAFRFVFTVMRERCLTFKPELDNVVPCIIQFSESGDGIKTPILRFPDENKPVDFKDVKSDVENTYAIWRDVRAERGKFEPRKKDNGSRQFDF